MNLIKAAERAESKELQIAGMWLLIQKESNIICGENVRKCFGKLEVWDKQKRGFGNHLVEA